MESCMPAVRPVRAPQRTKPTATVLLFTIVVTLAACTSNVKRSETTAQIHVSGPEEVKQFIFYRALSREDFRAMTPPPESAHHTEHLGALLCAAIIPSTDLLIEFDSTNDGDAHWFRVHGPNYRAAMDPECSWWNDEQTGFPPEYVLEHEQIHFALSEIYAMRINREIADLHLRVAWWNDAPEAAEARANQLLMRATDDLLEESRLFDKETSHKTRPETQSRWMQQVDARLNAR